MAVGLSPKAMHSAMNGRQHTLWKNAWWSLGMVGGSSLMEWNESGLL